MRRFAVSVYIASGSAAVGAQQSSVNCYAACVAPKPGAAPSECMLVAAVDPQKTPKPPSLDSKSYKLVKGCPDYQVEKGSVLLRYRRAGEWFTPPATLDPSNPNKLLKVAFEKFPADECGVPIPACTDKRMQSKQAGIGGHGIDGQPSTPGGTGNPCAIGLPCGRVLPPASQWRFQLEDATLNGQWVVQITRGTPPSGAPKQFSAAVNAGIVVTDGALLAPGATYGYRLLDGSGAVRATGEFSVLSRPLVQTLRGLAAKRVEAGQTEATAWVDALAANELDWDAYQLSVEAR